MATNETSIIEQFMGSCKNFNGLMNDKCDAGVTYDDFQVEDKAILYTLPCRKKNGCSEKCSLAVFMTEGEATEKLARMRAKASQSLELMANGTCPHCKRPMNQQQVGPCVYANPCGHRLYQGKIKKAS